MKFLDFFNNYCLIPKIKVETYNYNTVKQRPITLEVAETETAGWISRLAVCMCCVTV